MANLQYAPDFEIKINGERSPSVREAVTSVRYQDGIEGADRVEIALANENLRWFGSPLLKAGNKLSLKLGYVDDLEEVFTGEITGVEASFPSSGVPTVSIVGHDVLHRMTRGNKQIDWWPLPDVLIAAEIANRYGLDVEGDATAGIAAVVSIIELMFDHVKRQSASDFEFLSQIARDYGLDMYVDPRNSRILRFSGLDQGHAGSRLKWGESLIEFTPRVSTVGQVNVVAIRVYVQEFGVELVFGIGFDFDRGEFDVRISGGVQSLVSSGVSSALSGIPELSPFGSAAGSIAEAGIGQALEEIGLSSGGSGTWTMLDDVADPITAAKLVMAEVTRRVNQRLTGSGSAVGDPKIRGGQVIRIDGLGDSDFNGNYRVTSASHTIDSGGYRTSFEVRKAFGGIL